MKASDAKPFLDSIQADLAKEIDPQLRSWYETETSLTADFQEATRLQEQLHHFSGLVSQVISKAIVAEAEADSASLDDMHVDANNEDFSHPNGNSEASQAIKWASDILDNFLQLPSSRPVKQKKVDVRDGNFVRKHLEHVYIEGKANGSILLQPDLLAQSLESWTVAAEEQGGRTSRFLEITIYELGEMAKRQWKDMTKENLAGVMQGWTHAEFAADAFQYIVKKHFEGPGKLEDMLTAYLDLSLSTQYVLDDQPTIDRIADTLYYRTNVIPRGGQIQQAIYNCTYRVDNLELCKLANDVDKVSAGVSLIASGDRDTYIQDFYTGAIAWESAANIRSFAEANKLGVSAATKLLEDRREALKFFLVEQAAFDPVDLKNKLSQTFGEEITEWVWQAAFVSSQALAEYVRTFGARAMSKVMCEAFMDGNEQNPELPGSYKVSDVLSIPMHNDLMLDILIPEDWEHNPDELAVLLQEVNNLVGAQGYVDAEERLTNEEYGIRQALGYSRLLTNNLQLGEHRVVCAARFSCDLDRLQEHALNKLMWEDIQSIPVEQLGSNEAIAERIRQNQRRFVSKRGFKVEFHSDDLLQCGLQRIIFKKDPDFPRTLNVGVIYRDQPINFKLNEQLRIELEGRKLHSERLKETIEQRALAILEDYMTREALESSEGTISGAETGTTTRISHLAYLPQGHNFSKDAWEHCRSEQGADLRALSLRRKLVDSEGRNSTYRRATEYDDPNAEPLEIYIKNSRIV